MKKIRCDWDEKDFLKLKVADHSDVIVTVKQGDKRSRVRICPEKIHKLRKQLKRALIEIEDDSWEEKKDQDEGDDWFSAGKTVKVTGNSSRHEFPVGEVVRIIRIDCYGNAKSEYLDGHDYWWLNKEDCEPA